MSNRSTTIRTKLQHLSSGAAPRVIELCSGAGGMSLGFRDAGFDLRAHVEHWGSATKTYEHNFDSVVAGPIDMVKASPKDVLDAFGIEGKFEDAFDVLVAGLPCQAFARVGRSKLRSLAGGADEVHLADPRAQLYNRFLELVDLARPAVVVLENVPDILNFGGRNVPEEIAGRLEVLGYVTRYTLMNAAHYGVPQYRERLILLAYHETMASVPSFPAPTHRVTMRRGHRDLRTAATKYGRGRAHFVQPSNADEARLPAVTVNEALSDLPEIGYHRLSPLQRPKIEDELPYRHEPRSDFARSMRTRHGQLLERSSAHLIRVTPRDVQTFAFMAEGDQYPEALDVAERLFSAAAAAAGDKSSEDLAILRAQYVPPYDATKFANKWWKLVRDEPSRTLTAHLGRDTYSHIHPDRDQARMISVREAARLQSFPDWFEFPVSMNDAFQQIGNAVPPLLGRTIASEVMDNLLVAARPADTKVA